MDSVSNIPSSAAAATQSTNIPYNAAVAAQSSNTMLIDVPLAFIKAFRLRGDKVNLFLNDLIRQQLNNPSNRCGRHTSQTWMQVVSVSIRDVVLIGGNKLKLILTMSWLLLIY